MEESQFDIENDATYREAQRKPIELRSEEFREVLTQVPHWTIRWGITLIFVLIGILVSITYFIQYPDIIAGKLELTTKEPPVTLLSKNKGEIIDISIKPNVSVSKGTTLASLKSQLSKDGKNELEKFISEIKIQIQKQNFSSFPASSTIFAYAQEDYNKLITALETFVLWEKSGGYAFKKTQLEKELVNHNQLISISTLEARVAENELQIQQQEFEDHKALFTKGVISKLDYYKAQKELNGALTQKNNADKNIVAARLKFQEVERELFYLNQEHDEKFLAFNQTLISTISNLENHLKNYEENFAIVAPVDGTVHFNGDLHLNKNVDAREILFTIVPKNENYIAVAQIPADNYGKVTIGQKVRIKLNHYPHEEFGQLWGVISSISEVAVNNDYLVEIELSDGMISSYGKKLSYKPKMTGKAEIITEKLRLIERIFNFFSVN